MKPNIQFFALGFAAGAVAIGALTLFGVIHPRSSRPRSLSDELHDPRFRELMRKKSEEMQTDLLCIRLQAMATRADFAGTLLLSNSGEEEDAHLVKVIADFLNSEAQWTMTSSTINILEPILSPTKRKLCTLLDNNPQLKELVESARSEAHRPTPTTVTIPTRQ